MSEFAKLAAIIQSCNTEAQLKIAEKIVGLYIAKTNREFAHWIISEKRAYERLSNYGSLLAAVSDRLVDILDAPKYWKIGAAQ